MSRQPITSRFQEGSCSLCGASYQYDTWDRDDEGYPEPAPEWCPTCDRYATLAHRPAQRGVVVAGEAPYNRFDEVYVDHAGGVWHIQHDSPPIPVRHFDWCAVERNAEGQGALYAGNRFDLIMRVELEAEVRAEACS